MSVQSRVASDHELARLLQVGVVLEEVVEARATRHYRSMAAEDDAAPEVRELLDEAAEESAEHRERLEALIEELNAESVPYEEVEALVRERYGCTGPEDFDGVLYDQLASEETAYKFYDDLIDAIEDSDVRFSLDRERLLSVLADIRAEEQEGVEEVTEVMEARGA